MSKISDLSDGGSLTSTDFLVAVRSGGNVKVQADGAVSGTTITGSGDMNIDSGTLFVDASANAVGIGTTSPARTLSVNSGTTQITARFESTNITSARISLVDGNTTGDNYVNVASAGDAMALYAGAAERLRIDSSGNVGIGTTSPSEQLHIASAGAAIRLEDTDNSTYGQIVYNTAGGGLIIRSDEGAGAGAGSSNIIFETDGSPRVRFASSGNVGIGTTSPSQKLDVSGAGTTRIQVINTSLTSSGLLVAEDSTGAQFNELGAYPMRFNTSGTERMRIDSSGHLLVGTTNNSPVGNDVAGIALLSSGSGQFSRDGGKALLLNRKTSTGVIADFRKDSTIVGTISITSSATNYNTSSDARLKENIADAESASELIDAIQVRSFDWIADGSHQRYGMVAQELLEVAPEAVSQGETEEDMMGVDYSKLVPMLVKEIQSLRARVAQLEGA